MADLAKILEPHGADDDYSTPETIELPLEGGASIVLKIGSHGYSEDTVRALAPLIARDDVAAALARRLIVTPSWWESCHGDEQLRREVADALGVRVSEDLQGDLRRLRADLERSRAEAERMFVALGGGSDNADAHARACAVRYGL